MAEGVTEGLLSDTVKAERLAAFNGGVAAAAGAERDSGAGGRSAFGAELPEGFGEAEDVDDGGMEAVCEQTDILADGLDEGLDAAVELEGGGVGRRGGATFEFGQRKRRGGEALGEVVVEFEGEEARGVLLGLNEAAGEGAEFGFALAEGEFGALAVGDVAGMNDDAADGGIREEVGGGGVEIAPFAVLVKKADLDG